MIWIILAGIAIFFIVKMTVSYQKDNVELQERNLREKFHVLIGRLNEYAFNNAGTITLIDKRECNLYKEGANQIINFLYSQGTLNITWKYKYFQKEVIHKKSFVNCRNLSLFEQGDMASSVISEMHKIVEEHKNKVLPPERMESFKAEQPTRKENHSSSIYELSNKKKEGIASLLIVLAGADQDETNGIQDEEFKVINKYVEKFGLTDEFTLLQNEGLSGVIELLKNLDKSQKYELYSIIEELLESDGEINESELNQTNFIFTELNMSEFIIKTMPPA